MGCAADWRGCAADGGGNGAFETGEVSRVAAATWIAGGGVGRIGRLVRLVISCFVAIGIKDR